MSDQVKAFLIEVFNFLEGHGHTAAAVDVADFIIEQGGDQ